MLCLWYFEPLKNWPGLIEWIFHTFCKAPGLTPFSWSECCSIHLIIFGFVIVMVVNILSDQNIKMKNNVHVSGHVCVFMWVVMHVCVDVSSHVCVYIHDYSHEHTYTWLLTWTHIYMTTHMNTHIHDHSLVMYVCSCE
jgi:hypothetical protein